MAKNGKMQKVIMGILAMMFVVSLMLALASFIWPAPVYADFCYCEWRSCPYLNGPQCPPGKWFCWGFIKCCTVWGQCKPSSIYCTGCVG